MNSLRDLILYGKRMRWLTDPPDSVQMGMVTMISFTTEE